MMPIYLQLKLLGADPELLGRFHEDAYEFSKPKASSEYQNFLRSKLVPLELDYAKQQKRLD